MTVRPRVTLVSNINHSVHAARALNRLGVLDQYLGPVVLDAESSWVRRMSPRLHAARAYQDVHGLPLRRLMLPEITARTARRLPLGKTTTARFNAQVLDRLVSPRMGFPDVLHVNTAGLVRSVRRAKQRGALVVADHREVHPRDHSGEDPLLAGLEAELEMADWVLANSDRSARSLVHWGVPRSKVVTLPLGVDLDRFGPGDRRPRSRDDGVRLLFVGALIPAKGIDTLLEAVQQAGFREATLRLCGRRVDGALAARCEAAPGVTVLGPVDRSRLVEEYRQADVLVLPSHNDAFGLVALEALACGTPVVVTDECGVAPLISEKVGRSVPATDGPALAEALRQAVMLARYEGTAASARAAAAKMSWKVYEDRLARFYREIVLPAVSPGVC